MQGARLPFELVTVDVSCTASGVIIISLRRLGSTGEYLVAIHEANILLYCPPTREIM